MTPEQKAAMLIGAVLGAFGLLMVQSFVLPSREEIIAAAWHDWSVAEGAYAAPTGALLHVQDAVREILRERPDRAEIEAIRRKIRVGEP